MTRHQLVLDGNTSASAVIDVISTASTHAVIGGASLRSGSPWLWAPHVAIGALLVLLMAASFVRFHCKYGHKYRTGSQSFSSTLRLAPKTAWTLDKKISATSLPRSRSGHGVTVAGTTSGLQGRRAARPAAVIVLKPVGGALDQSSAAPGTTSLTRRSVDSVGDSTTTVDEAGQSQVKSALYMTSSASTLSVERGKMADSTTLDMDVMSTSRGSDEDWAAVGFPIHASDISTDPWSAIEHRHDPAQVTTLTTTAIVCEQAKTDEQQTEIDWSATTATSHCSSSTCYWPAETSTGTNSTRMSGMFPSLSVFRHHPTTLQGATSVSGDTERLIDDMNDKSIL